MTTPIFDFVKRYGKSDSVRLHMPGHKGKTVLGVEGYDLTELEGADSLYEASGIIAQSEKNLAEIFGTKQSFYSTEGSSLCIRAMLQIVLSLNKSKGRKTIVAARNVHKAYLYAAALLDFDTVWLKGENDTLYSCSVNCEQLEKALECKPAAVYVTSPDYLGNILDIKAIAEVCKKNDVPLIVDNAHGAYLKFLKKSMHPIDLGADMCCDSAHKTLPVLTGGAYLHVSKQSKYGFERYVKNALSLFGSTSPSYLVLCSMDKANQRLALGFKQEVLCACEKTKKVKDVLKQKGFMLYGNEMLKITVMTKVLGYYGYEFAEILRQNQIFCEAYDTDCTVLMFSPDNSDEDYERLCFVVKNLEKRNPINEKMPCLPAAQAVMTVKQAVMSRSEEMDIKSAEGRILATPCVSCPPAIPIVICGEVITKEAVECFSYYGRQKVEVVAVDE